MVQFDCARMTVNRALTALTSAGLIVRRRRAGSFVAVPASEQTVLEIHDIKAEILNSGQSYRFDLLERKMRELPLPDRANLEAETGTPVLALQVLHFAAEHPFAFEDRVINLAAVPAAESEAFADTPPGTWLLDHIPWTDAVHRISAIPAGRRLEKMLDLPRGAASLMVERRTWRAEMPVTAVRLYYPGNRHELVARFNPRS